jgi:hypothetical protein
VGIKSEYLDLVVGLAVVFFLASLAVSGINEALQWVTRIRAKFLWAFLFDLTDPVRRKSLPRGLLGVLRLWRKNDKRPVVEGSTGVQDRDEWPEWLLLRLARSLGPVDAPELRGRTKRTAISYIPSASLAQAFLEVFAEMGRERTDAALADLAAALVSDDDPGPVIARLSEGVGNDPAAKAKVSDALAALASSLRDAQDDGAARAAGHAFGEALLGISGARPGPAPDTDLRTAGADLAGAVLAARRAPEADRATTEQEAMAEAQVLSSAIISTFPDRFARQRIEIALVSLGDAPIGPTARRIWESVGGQIDDFRMGLEEWFDSEMTRLSGYYRRSIRLLLGILALLVAVLANLDSLQLTTDLWRNPEGRAALVTRADEVVDGAAGGAAPPAGASLERLHQECREAAPTQDDEIRNEKDAARAYGEVRACVNGALDELTGLNVVDEAVWSGWDAWADEWDPTAGSGRRWGLHLLGVAVTALALMLGAPFWFDLLKRVTGIRKGLVGRT